MRPSPSWLVGEGVGVRRGGGPGGAGVECRWVRPSGRVGPGLALEVACGLRGRGELQASARLWTEGQGVGR